MGLYQEGLYSVPLLANLPQQMIPNSAKDDEWKQANMDALEAVGRSQFIQNMRLVENYEMVKGKFIFAHYFQQDDYVDLIGQLTKEFELPSYLRHYDIIAQVINTLSGEWQARPDLFKVKAHDEHTGNEYERTQTDLLLKYVMAKINAEVARKMLDAGLDPNKKDFNSPEEEKQYQQTIQQAQQEMTPPAIQEYMKSDWFTAAEAWGEHQLELDKERFRLKVKEKKEFEDMLVADRCFRHFYLTPSAYEQETWNPINVFYHKSPDVENIEEGDYVGRIFWLTVPDIIDRYGHLMKKTQIESLQEYLKQNDNRWSYASGTDYVYQNYLFPFKGYPAYDIIRQTQAFQNQDSNLPFLDATSMSSLFSGRYFSESKGYYFVIEAYWKSQEKIGKVTYIDPDTGLIAKSFVDENFVVPEGFTQLDSDFSNDTAEPGTVIWSWVNRVWRGVKLCTKSHSGFTQDMYLDIHPIEFQFKGDINPYRAKLPVCGQVFSIRNSQSMSLVDLMKPHQIGHNVAMNQAYQEMQKDVGKFIVMDINMFPDLKDWGGEQGLERFMLLAKELGVTLMDTSSANTKGAAAAAGGHAPKEIDMDASARILSRLNIADQFEQHALRHIGFNQFRLGQQSNSAPVGSVEAGQERSFAQTESYFTNFSNYVQRCHKMDLDIAQFVQSRNQDVTVSYVKSDLSRAFIKIAGTELLLADLHVYVSNSKENERQLDALRQLAMSNNTTNASIVDLADIIIENSPAQIRKKLQASFDRQQDLLNRQFQIQEQKIEQDRQIKILTLQQDAETSKEQIQGKEQVAYIQTFGRQVDNLKDENKDNIPDVLEYDKLDAKQQADQSKNQIQQEKNQLQRNKQIADATYNSQKLDLEKQKIEAGLRMEDKKLQVVQTLKKQDIKTKNRTKKK